MGLNTGMTPGTIPALENAVETSARAASVTARISGLGDASVVETRKNERRKLEVKMAMLICLLFDSENQ